MSLTLTSSGHLLGSNPLTGTPVTMSAWINSPLIQFGRILTLYNGTTTVNQLGMLLDVSGATDKISAYAANASFNNQGLSSTAPTANVWHRAMVVLGAFNSRFASYDVGNEGAPSTASITAPAGINRTVYGGRPGDFLFYAGGPGAHVAVWNRILSLLERDYDRAGGNPRALKGLARYWKFSPLTVGQTVVPDEMGVEPLTIVGSVATGVSDPGIQTYYTGTPLPNQTWTIGGSNASVAFATRFDDVTSDYTLSLLQLGNPTKITTATIAAAALRELQLPAIGAFANGDYLQAGLGGTPTRVYRADAGTARVLVADDQTYSASTDIYRYTPTVLTLPGVSFSGKTLVPNVSGGAGTYPLLLVRATNTVSTSQSADSNIFTATVSSTPSAFLARPRRRKRRRFLTVFIRR